MNDEIELLKAKLEARKELCYNLQSKIDKAIECINYYAIEDDDFNKLYDVEEQELLEILGDKENEN